MKRISIILILFVLAATSGFAQKNHLTRDEYAQWQNLRSYNLSDNGKWIYYTISPVDGNDTLFIQSTQADDQYKFALCSRPVFSDNSKWLAAQKGYSEKEIEKMKEKKKTPKNKLLLLNLETGEERIFHDIESFTMAKGSKHLIMAAYKNDKASVKDIFLYHLDNSVIKTIGNISEYSINKKGNRLLYAVSTNGMTGNGVELFNLNDYSSLVIDNDSSKYSKLRWEKEGNAFSFLKSFSDTGFVENNNKLFAVRNIYDKIDIMSLNPVDKTEIPDLMKIRETYSPRFSKDLSIVYFGVYKWTVKEKKDKKNGKKDKEDSDDKLPGVDVWHWKDDPIQPLQEKQYSRTGKDFTYLFAWNLKNNKIVRITDDDFKEATITGDGKNVLIRTDKPYIPSFRLKHYDHYLVNSATGEKKLLIENFTRLYGSSPDGKHILYFKDKNWWVYDIALAEHRNISSGIDTELWNTRDDSPKDIKPPFGNGGWYENDAYLLLYDEYDIWKVAVESAECSKLTNGKEDEIRYRALRLEFEDNFFKSQDDLYISASGYKTKKSGFYKITSQGKRVQLIYDDLMISGLRKAKSWDKFAFRSESYVNSPDLFVTNSLFKKKKQITATNPQQEDYYWGRSELINYTNADGKELQGALFYPANYEEGKEYPMVVYIYEIKSTNLHRYLSPSLTSAYNTTNYTTSGYFVFQPDIIYKVNQPGESAVDCVVPAVNKVLESGMIDKERIALMGHSWGAYQAAFIITQTDLFSSAIAGAPLINMISMYNEIYWNSGSPNQQIFETSQGRLREPWWEIMDDYMANSPMFNAENITTPLLVTFGNKDGAVDWHQGLEMFATMRRMEKPFILLVYDGENHGLRKKENMKDYSIKVNDFLNHYTLGKEAEKWIQSGKTYIDKKEEEQKKNNK